MKPAFSLKTSGLDLTAKIADRLERLVVTDEAGVRADRLQIVLDFRGMPFAAPELGSPLELALGYGSNLTVVGTYFLDEVTVSGPVRKMALIASAVDFRSAVTAAHEFSWHNTHLGAVVSAIAKRHKLKPKVAPDLANIEIEHEDQTEGDMQFLMRLALEHGATVTVKGGKLVVVRAATKTGVSGTPAPQFLIRPELIDASNGWETIEATRGNYTGVKAAWQDRPKAIKKWLQVGDSAKVTSLPYQYPSEEEARRAAEAKLRALQRGTRTFHFTTLGDPLLAAEHRVVATGFDDGSDGEWVITRLEHILDKTNFLSRVECEFPADLAQM